MCFDQYNEPLICIAISFYKMKLAKSTSRRKLVKEFFDDNFWKKFNVQEENQIFKLVLPTLFNSVDQPKPY